MKYDVRKIMQRAWEIYRTLQGDRIAKIAYAMKQAWAEAKQPVAPTGEIVKGWNVTALEEAGACRWQKYGKDRLYIGDIFDRAFWENNGLKYDRYKSGNICWATFNGEDISNADCCRILAVWHDTYIDLTTGKIYACGYPSKVDYACEPAWLNFKKKYRRV